MNSRILLVFFFFFCILTRPLMAQTPLDGNSGSRNRYHIQVLDDAQLDIGLSTVTIFALDDRAPLSSNPHFQAMLNLIKLGATLEAILQGLDQPLNDIDMGREFGLNGYNKTVINLFFRYGFGESSDVKLQQHFLELSFSPGYFKEGNGGLNIHLDYRMNIGKTNYGAGGRSIERPFDYEFFIGARTGFDWSSARSESEAGFFAHLNDEIKRIASENELTVSQLLMLEQLAEDSKILLPKDVGGRALHIGPIAGAQLSKRIIGNTRAFLNLSGFYDLMDLDPASKGKENKRSQHHISLNFGFNIRIGAEGEIMDFFR